MTYFKTKELTFWQKLLQVYWFTPKSYLLDEFILDQADLTIIRKNNTVFKAKLSSITTTYFVDDFQRREYTIIDTLGNKTRFKEIPDMLSVEEWVQITILLNASEAKYSKIIHWIRSLMGKR
ncbi:MAG: hypothetical protein JKY03_12240 [Aureispira sp.]|nr:hypothetical protein [Aureispira sp.]